VPAELKLITHDACYFLLKSNNFDNLLLAKAESVWSTPPQNELRINSAFRVCEHSAVFIVQCTEGILSPSVTCSEVPVAVYYSL